MRKVTHFIPDNRHANSVIPRFEAHSPGLHRYVCVSARSASRQPRHLRQPALITVSTPDEARQYLNHIDSIAVVFHSLPRTSIPLLLFVEEGLPVFWLGMGYDYYETLLQKAYPPPLGLLEPLTLEMEREIKAVEQRSWKSRLNLVGPQTKLRTHLRKALHPLLQRVDFFGPVLRSEYSLARRQNPWFSAEFLPWSWTANSPEHTLSIPPVITKERLSAKQNILVGNSATLTNNHLDAFALITRRLDPDSYERVICPLSYGKKEIAKAVSERGYACFGRKFQPVLEFLPRHDYAALMESCHTVLMNHVRQQALGNLAIAASSGARIVLNPRSPVCEEYHERGVSFETTEAFGVGPLDLDHANRNLHAVRARQAVRIPHQQTDALMARATRR